MLYSRKMDSICHTLNRSKILNFVTIRGLPPRSPLSGRGVPIEKILATPLSGNHFQFQLAIQMCFDLIFVQNSTCLIQRYIKSI